MKDGIILSVWISFGVVIVSLALVGASILSPYSTQGLGIFGIRAPFGGRISGPITCSCRPGGAEVLWALSRPSFYTWAENREGFIIVGPYTKYYLKSKLTAGEWVVGMAIDRPVVCSIFVPGFFGGRCVPVATGYPVQYIGSSLP